MITKEDIHKNLKTKSFGKVVFAFESIDSTNTFAKSLSQNDAPHGTVIIADEQIAGRGRFQRHWVSTKGLNLLLSIILYPDFSIEKISLLPFVGALAVSDAIGSIVTPSCECKWPNDILINRKKICGMLLESVGGKVILGIGLNVNQEIFLEELRNKATSLKLETGNEIDRAMLLRRILEEAEQRYEQLSRFPSRQIINDWKRKSLHFGKKITVLEHEFTYSATALDVADDGSLIIQTEDGLKKQLYTGDISLVYS
jgi:BirA family transcriptional regulator, biotin operon repressor / biotin---[acetyl-CoA-carboxylase] ligase